MSPAAKRMLDGLVGDLRLFMASGKRISGYAAGLATFTSRAGGEPFPPDAAEYLEAMAAGRPWGGATKPAAEPEKMASKRPESAGGGPTPKPAADQPAPSCGVEGCPACPPSEGPTPRSADWLLEFMKLAGEIAAGVLGGGPIKVELDRLRVMAKAAGETAFAVAVGPHVLVIGTDRVLVLPLLGMMAVPDMRV